MTDAGTRPLNGVRVVVTRAAEQAGEFSGKLREAGAEVVELPTILTVPVNDYSALDGALLSLGSFDYIVFTSFNAIKYFFQRAEAIGASPDLSGLEVIAVGPKTARELDRRGVRISIVPAEFRQEGVIAELEKRDLHGKRFLYPRAEEAREALPECLRDMGADILVAPAYKTVAPDADPEGLRVIFSGGGQCFITFTSSSTVKNFAAMAGSLLSELIGNVKVACIGPVTAKTCEELGLSVSVMPDDYTVDALFRSITEAVKKERTAG
ncbi:MAG TPA: uroporphyrinogen-III synthase [Nitrospirota bacterium]|jgi:uroporphyrinogen III methyltransferase/synthase